MLAAVGLFGCALLAGTFNTVRATAVQEYLLFDFYSRLPPSEVKKQFNGLPVVKSLKAVGEGRYIFVVKDEQTPELRNLSLPADAYNERVFPAETNYDFYSHFTGNVPFRFELTDLPDKGLLFVERTWIKPAGTYSEMKSTMANFAQELAEFYSQYSADNPPPAHGFNPSGQLPIKNFVFINMPLQNTVMFLLKKDTAFGTLDSCEVSIVSIFNI